MKKSKEEILEAVRTMVGETPSDDALTLLEDISDSMNIEIAEDQYISIDKYKKLDADWRKKYADRFLRGEETKEKEETKEEEEEEIKIEDIFKEV